MSKKIFIENDNCHIDVIIAHSLTPTSPTTRRTSNTQQAKVSIYTKHITFKTIQYPCDSNEVSYEIDS